MATTRANILVVLSDQQRPDSCGVFGQRLDVTPNLDALAAGGVAFDNAFTVQPVCGPARAAMQTGRYPTEVGCWRNGLALPPGEMTLASEIGALGYQTGYVGKWHLASDRGPRLPHERSKQRWERAPVPPSRRGGYSDVWVGADALEMTSGAYGGHLFDEQGERVELEGYRVDGLTDVAIERLGSFERDRPFMMWVSYLEPHHQNDRFRIIGPTGWAKRFKDFEVPKDLSRWRGDWRWNYAEYLAACASVDQNLGRLVDELRRLGTLDDTIIVFTSDHGTHFRTRNLEYKRSPHDASIRVPMVVSGPGFEPGRRSSDLVTHLDLMPTFLHAAGAGKEVVDSMRGSSLMSRIDRDEFLIQISESQIGRTLRTRRYTLGAMSSSKVPLAGHLQPSASSYRVTHLYDNEADPHQLTNLARQGSSSAIRRELSERLVDQIRTIEGESPAIE